jgi:D-arabinose 1-dehydrogenase-like Zn-dependent alcohol dehydrogenase
MVAMQIPAPGAALVRIERLIPDPGPGEVLIEVAACGVCRTDLHVLDGEIPAHYPIIPGHEIVGRVAALGNASASLGSDIHVAFAPIAAPGGKICATLHSSPEPPVMAAMRAIR